MRQQWLGYPPIKCHTWHHRSRKLEHWGTHQSTALRHVIFKFQKMRSREKCFLKGTMEEKKITFLPDEHTEELHSVPLRSCVSKKRVEWSIYCAERIKPFTVPYEITLQKWRQKYFLDKLEEFSVRRPCLRRNVYRSSLDIREIIELQI